jgi:hypothetical protein
MSDLELPAQLNRTYLNRYLLYDLDVSNKQIYQRIRLLVKEGENEIQTPQPPLYLARLEAEKPLEVPKRNDLELRVFQTCFQSPQDPTTSALRTVYCPYRGGMAEVGQLAEQLINYPDVLAVEYRGESQNRNYQEFA